MLENDMQATVKNGARSGRGFSLPELKEAGFDARTARKHGVPTDVWRSTKYQENVEQLKAAAKSIEAPRKEVKQKEEAQKPAVTRKATKPVAKRKTTSKKKTQQKQKTGKSRSKK